jgi:hypothetical protein
MEKVCPRRTYTVASWFDVSASPSRESQYPRQFMAKLYSVCSVQSRKSSDLVAVFQRGKYESSIPASWSDGDLNCDGDFGSADLVTAFQRGW